MTIQKLITVNDIAINTLTAGQGENAIFFIHGNSCNATYWTSQLEDAALQGKFTMIAFDLPGHGNSGCLTDYQLQAVAAFIPAITEVFPFKKFIVAGLSFGTSLIGEASLVLKNCKGFFMASPNLTNNTYSPSAYILPFPEAYAMMSAEVSDEVLTRFAEKLINNTTSALVQQFKASYLRTDPQFRLGLANAIQVAGWSDEFANLNSCKVPSLFVFGEAEKVLNIHYLDNCSQLENYTVHLLDNAAHFVNLEQPALFNQMLNEFASRVFNQS